MEHPPTELDPSPRLLWSLVAGLLVVRFVEHPLVAVAIVAAAMAVIWGWPS
jgi:mannose/fructose/N-acetylgalactosamine-specific phosphotransferase system component IIC